MSHQPHASQSCCSHHPHNCCIHHSHTLGICDQHIILLRQDLGQPVFPTAHQLHSGYHLAGCISATARTQLLAPRMYKPSDRSYPETVDTSPPWLPWLSNLAANCTHKHLAHCLAAAAIKNVSGCSTPVILFSISSSGIKFAGNSFSISNVSNSRNISLLHDPAFDVCARDTAVSKALCTMSTLSWAFQTMLTNVDSCQQQLALAQLSMRSMQKLARLI